MAIVRPLELLRSNTSGDKSMRSAFVVAALLFLASVWANPAPITGESQSRNWQFEKPVRLKSANKFIDAADVGGHASPWLVDVDGDGKRDMVVGDFSGKFRLFLNTGTNGKPVYRDGGFLKAGGVDAEVPIY